MKKNIILILATFCLLHGAVRAQDMMQDVRAQLPAWLEKIPYGQESHYGFATREDFRLASLGAAVQVFTLDASFFSDPAPSNGSSLIATGEWRIPVAVHDRSALLLTVVQRDQGWKIVDLGAHVLANELDEYHQLDDIRNADVVRVLRVYQLQSDFLFTENPAFHSAQISLYPLHSARTNIPRLQNSEKRKTALSELLPLLKERLKKQ